MADNSNKDKQVKNDLNAIKAQLIATINPAELARLNNAAASLLSSTNNPELIEQIKSVQAAISKKEENAEQNISSKISVEDLEILQQQEPDVMCRQTIHEKHNILKAQHTKIMQDADKYIDQKKKENEELKGLLNDIKVGKEIDPERLKSFIKTEAQLREEQEVEKALKEAQQRANQHYQEMQAQEKAYKKQQAQCAREVEVQRKANEKLSYKDLEQGQHKLSALKNKIQQQNVKIADFQLKLQEAKVMKDEIDEKVKDLDRKSKEGKDIQNEIIKKIDEMGAKQHNPALADFSSLLLNQTKAMETSKIEDLELRNKLLGIESNKVNTLGDKVLELKEKFNFKSVPEEEKQNIKQELKNGLQKQNSLSSENKEMEVNKHLNKTNQQNRKNEGHTR